MDQSEHITPLSSMYHVAQNIVPQSVANHYGLNRGMNRIGAIAPGYQADLVMLEDVSTCSISQVFKKGIDVSELVTSKSDQFSFENSVHAHAPEESELKAETGQVYHFNAG